MDANYRKVSEFKSLFYACRVNKKQLSLGKRVLAACAIAFTITRILPSLADTNSPNPNDPQQNPTVQVDSSTISASSTPAPTVAPDPALTPVPGASITYLPNSGQSPSATTSATPTSIPDAAITLHIPSVIKVDPRAQIAVISPISISSREPLLVCMSSNHAQIEVSAIPPTILADQSSPQSVLLSGSASNLTALLGAGQGLRLMNAPRVGNSLLTLKIVAVTAPTVDSGLCADPGATQSVSVSALGLEEGLVKVPLALGKKR